MILCSKIQGYITIVSKFNYKFFRDFCDLPIKSHLNGMPFLLSSYQLRWQIDFFLHVRSSLKCVRPRIPHRKTLITNKYFPLNTKIIFRTVIVADCKSTIQFLQLDIRHTRVYLCYCSDQVLYKWRLLRNVLLCCSGWVALLFVVSNGHDTENLVLLPYYAGSSGNFLPTFRDNLSIKLRGQISCLVPLFTLRRNAFKGLLGP